MQKNKPWEIGGKYLRSLNFVSPDHLFHLASDYTAFVFNKKHILSFAPQGTHSDIYDRDSFRRRNPNVRNRATASYNVLSGRIGNDYKPDKNKPSVKIISFWNTDKEMYDELLGPCLARLKRKKLIDDNTLFSSPFQPHPVPLTQINKNLSPLSDDEVKHVKNLQQIHTLNADEKRKALLDRGASPKSSPWIKQLGPGIKTWAIHSESMNFKLWLEQSYRGYRIEKQDNREYGEKIIWTITPPGEDAAVDAMNTLKDAKALVDLMIQNQPSVP